MGKLPWRLWGHFRPESWLQTAPVQVILCLLLSLAPSVKRSNCYMVWGGDIVATSQRASRSNVDLEIGCLVDLAMGMLSFSANGRELGTCYQVGVASGTMTVASQARVLRALLLSSVWLASSPQHMELMYLRGPRPSRKTDKNKVTSFCSERERSYLLVDWKCWSSF